MEEETLHEKKQDGSCSIDEVSPIQVFPKEMIAILKDVENSSIADSRHSLDTYKQENPRFQEQFGDSIDEMGKFLKLISQNMKNLPISVLLKILSAVSDIPEILPHLLDYPPAPAADILEVYCGQLGDEAETWSSKEKQKQFLRIADCNSIIRDLLVEWKDQIEEFVEKLGVFLRRHSQKLSKVQQNHIHAKIERASRMIPEIEKQIKIKRILVEKEKREFEQFLAVVSQDEEFRGKPSNVRQKKIREAYDKLDDFVIRAVIRNTPEFDPNEPVVHSSHSRTNSVPDRSPIADCSSPTSYFMNGEGSSQTPETKNSYSKNKKTERKAKKSIFEVGPSSAKRVRRTPKRFEEFEVHGRLAAPADDRSSVADTDDDDSEVKVEPEEESDVFMLDE